MLNLSTGGYGVVSPNRLLDHSLIYVFFLKILTFLQSAHLSHDDVVIFYISFANLPSLHTSQGKFGFSKHGYLFYLNEALIHSVCVIKTMHTTEWHFI